ncbi:MAG: ABC transporter ATP-binding protein [Erysipelotrichaceae bacterium]
MEDKKVILKVSNLKTHFDVTKGLFAKKQIVKAVDDVSFEVYENETFGLVGESGCGKTTLGRTIVKLYDPVSGSIEFEGKDIAHIKGAELKAFRKDMQMIFQDPYASLNPRMTVGEIIKEPMVIHNIYNTDAEREARVVELLKIVGLKPDHIRRYPSEFSGGQRQRIGIARALAVNPKFIVCDEPISALDVSIQAQVINLLKDIQKEMGISYLFIAHDLSMVKHISDRIGVMYLGHMMELGPSNDVYKRPLHPYTVALLSAIPISDPDIAKRKQRIILEGEIPSPINPPTGCPFSTRCSKATERCKREMPQPVEVGDRLVSCFLYEK